MRWLLSLCVVAAACRVDSHSDKLRCSTQADCSSGRFCQAGYCITDPTIDGAIAMPGIACGNGSRCTGGTPCCLASESCTAACNGVTVACDDNADCPGLQVCCGAVDPSTGSPSGASCTTVCAGPGVEQLCDPGVPGECGTKTCKPARHYPGYDSCQ